MTAAELIRQLQQLPPDTSVVFARSDYDYAGMWHYHAIDGVNLGQPGWGAPDTPAVMLTSCAKFRFPACPPGECDRDCLRPQGGAGNIEFPAFPPVIA